MLYWLRKLLSRQYRFTDRAYSSVNQTQRFSPVNFFATMHSDWFHVRHFYSRWHGWTWANI